MSLLNHLENTYWYLDSKLVGTSILVLNRILKYIFLDQVNMEVMDEMNDKLSALNESLSDDVDQVIMDLDELELKHQQDISKFYFQYKLQIFCSVSEIPT